MLNNKNDVVFLSDKKQDKHSLKGEYFTDKILFSETK